MTLQKDIVRPDDSADPGIKSRAATADMLARLETFQFHKKAPAFSFADRLARDNGWTRRFADRVIREYLRFVFLCATSNQMLTPSEEVDQAWHLHMVYTRSYWDHLCADILGMPLHHDPTPGGAKASDSYANAYQKTLDRYAQEFGEPPPMDVWPSVKERFAGVRHFRRVNVAQYLLLPVRKVKSAVVALGIGLAAAPAYAAADWVSLLTVIGGVILIPAAVIGLFGAQMKAMKKTSNNHHAGGGCGGSGKGGSASNNSNHSDGGGDSGCGSGCGGCGG